MRSDITTETPPGVVVHRLRLRPAHEDPALLVPAGDTGLAAGLADQIRRLAESGIRGTGPVLTYSRLPDGGSVLCRFIPADNSSCLDVRVAVLSEEAARARLTPIDAWPEECWTTRPGTLTPRPWIDRTELVRFAAEARGQLPCVLADVRELFAGRAGPQILLVERRPHDVARWIALICASLPQQAARELTFTTSATRPYAAFEQIVGVPPEAEFAFSEVELRHLYRVRSAEGRCSPALGDPWAEIAARLWQHGRPELITDTARIPLGAPFDAGRLAAVALLELLPVGREAELLAAAWISRPENTGGMAQQDVDGLMDALTRIDRAAVGAAGPRPAALGQILRAFRSLRRRATPEVAAPVALSLGRAALRTALDRCAVVSADPLADLGLDRADRERLAAEFGAEVRAVLDAGDSSSAERAGSLVLARALELDPSGPYECAANRRTV
ncbi:GTPase-associated protein 1-related protein [Actinospica sp.]|uniref:GTPase-associated protein 1-related protein n=1 Tax=Actinospica sp. TaxID=1872142 RepID=UPI002BAAC069|nr:GTPase-associated protein 1-related protein [Actinospica sp.]HWG28508.1 GTPase-associated protein 1-related protein [Actinospica sp.]